MTLLLKIILVYFVLINLVTFLLYGSDKSKARRHRYRISEFRLILPAFLGGGLGAFLGMRVFRHKTLHRKFQILIPIALVWSLLVFAFLAVTAADLNISGNASDRQSDRYRGEIEAYTSRVDKDGDGVDDQTDILQNAIEYIKTEPKYESRYYNSGYPDDGYGVCTDVVGYALLHSGYDLQKLVDEDIAAYPEDYNIDEADPKIDFRRVRNLRVFFSHTAISLTTDIYDIEEWQGGDIVVFEKHIGIVSDRRNQNGVPYVIHHSNPGQIRYEQDILENRSDITNHFRIS